MVITTEARLTPEVNVAFRLIVRGRDLIESMDDDSFWSLPPKRQINFKMMVSF
jgi:hypothetical protein